MTVTSQFCNVCLAYTDGVVSDCNITDGLKWVAVVNLTDWLLHCMKRQSRSSLSHQKRRHLRQTEAEPRYPQSDAATTTPILWPREQNGTRSLSKAGTGRVCTRPARTRATKEKMAQRSQEQLCWHGPDCTRRDSSCPRQRRLETIHSQAAVAGASPRH